MADIEIDPTIQDVETVTIEERMKIIRQEFKSQMTLIKRKFVNVYESSSDQTFDSLWNETKVFIQNTLCVNSENLKSSKIEDEFQDVDELMKESNDDDDQSERNNFFDYITSIQFKGVNDQSMEEDDNIFFNQIQDGLTNMNWDQDLPTMKNYLTVLLNSQEK